MNSPGIRPYVFMLCGCGWFAAMSLLTNSLGRERCPWQTLATVRSIVAFLIALGVAVAARVPLVVIGPKALWLRSIAGSLSMLSTFYALANLNASVVLTLTMTFPVWVAILSWPMTGEKPSLGVWVAVLVAVLGVMVAVLPRGLQGTSDLVFDWWPAVSALAASMFTALAMLGLNRLQAIRPLAVVVHFSAVSIAFAVAGYLFFEVSDGPDGFHTPDATVRLMCIGLTAMVGQVFLTLAFSGGSATKVSVVGLMQVVIAMAFEVCVGWRTITPWDVLGTLLVMGPTGWLLSRERKQMPVEETAIE
jgi:drug/metabolite transporter (DMT)-like permease